MSETLDAGRLRRYVKNRYLNATLGINQEYEVVASYIEGGVVRYIYVDLITPFAAVLRQRIKDDHQNIVLVSGGTGSGKSNAAVALARAIDPKWKIAENYIYSLDDLRNKLRSPNYSPVSLFDEASVSLNSNNSQTKDSKMMTVIFDTMRSRGQTYILCIPNMMNLNNRVREEHVDFLMLCPSISPIPGCDPRGMIKIYRRVDRDWAKSYFQLIGTALFQPMSTRLNNQYQKIKAEHQDILIDKFIAQGEA